MSDNLIERLTRAAAEADGQVWEGLSCKHTYANMAGAVLQELAKSGERMGAGHLATELRNQIIQELIEKAQESETRFAAWFVQDLKPVAGEDRGRREPIDQRHLADWLKSQMEGGE